RPSTASTARNDRGQARAAGPARSGRDELKALAKKWFDRGRQYVALTKEETSDQKRIALGRRLLPVYDPRAVEAFFDVEKRSRGQDVGLFALNFVVLCAGGVGNPDMAVVHGRDRALLLLRGSYLGHEDLDIIFPSLRWGPVIFGAEELFKAAVQK